MADVDLDPVVPESRKRNKIPAEIAGALADGSEYVATAHWQPPATVKRYIAERDALLLNPEEKPVGTGASTFEELLERKLREGVEPVAPSSSREAQAAKHEFLKKGTRTARMMPSSPQLGTNQRLSVSSSHSSVGQTPQFSATFVRTESPEADVVHHAASSRGSAVRPVLTSDVSTKEAQKRASVQPRPFLRKGARASLSGHLGVQKNETTPRPSASSRRGQPSSMPENAKRNSAPPASTASGSASVPSRFSRRSLENSDDEDFEHLERQVMEEDDVKPTPGRASQTSRSSPPSASRSPYVMDENGRQLWSIQRNHSPTKAWADEDGDDQPLKQSFQDSSMWEEEAVEHDQDADGRDGQSAPKPQKQSPQDARFHDEPPVSSLVDKLFHKRPAGKRADSSSKLTAQRDAGQAAKQPSPDPTAAMLPDELEGVLRQKLRALDEEIARFKSETDRLKKLSDARDKELVRLDQAKSQFEKSRAEELEQLDLLKAEELRKLKKERKLVEQQAKMNAQYAANAKREREELDNLRVELAKLREDSAAKEVKWKSTSDRLQRRVDELSAKTKELEKDLADKVALLVTYEQKESARKKEALRSKSPLIRYPTIRNEDIPALQSPARGQSSPPPADRMRAGSLSNLDERPQASPQVTEPVQEVLSSSSLRSLREVPSILPQQDSSRSLGASSTADSVSATASSVRILKDAFAESFSAVEEMQERRRKLRESMAIRESLLPDGKTEYLFGDGSKLTCFVNQTKKVTDTNGVSALYFTNGDIKKTSADGKVLYYYAEAQTVHTTYPDGTEIFAFSSGQVERQFPNGKKHILFSDGAFKTMNR